MSTRTSSLAAGHVLRRPRVRARPRAAPPPLLLAAAGSTLAAWLVGLYLAHNCIRCDTDVATAIAWIDWGEGELPIGSRRPLLPFVLLAVKSAIQPLTGWPLIVLWQHLVAASLAAISLALFAAAWLLTRDVTRALLAAAVGWASGGLFALVRVLEDNLLSNALLAATLLLLVMLCTRPQRWWLAPLAGLTWAAAFLLGKAGILWLPMLALAPLLIPLSFPRRAAVLAATLASALGPAFTAGVAMEMAYGRYKSIPSPYEYFVKRLPADRLLAQRNPPHVMVRYVLLGVHTSLAALPADPAREWNLRIREIRAGTQPGVLLHGLTAFAWLGLLAAAAIARLRPGPRRVYYLVLAGLAAATAPNLIALDGSFIERFDHVPLMTAVVVALLLAPHAPPARWRPALACTFALLLIGVNTAYAVLSRGRQEPEFRQMRKLAARMHADERAVLAGHFGLSTDDDRFVQSASLWIGRRRAVLLGQPGAEFRGYYMARPYRPRNAGELRSILRREFAASPDRAGNSDPNGRPDAVSKPDSSGRAGPPGFPGLVLNEAAAELLRDLLAADGLSLEPFEAGGFRYYRAVPRLKSQISNLRSQFSPRTLAPEIAPPLRRIRSQ